MFDGPTPCIAVLLPLPAAAAAAESPIAVGDDRFLHKSLRSHRNTGDDDMELLQLAPFDGIEAYRLQLAASSSHSILSGGGRRR
jgi:hypothetical protein